jgi:AcrR family transcriptional regulator
MCPLPIAVRPKDEMIREEVITAARDLFQRYGLIKTTMEDISRAAGKGKSTLYYYYANKDEIFDTVIKEDMEEVFTLVKMAVSRAASAVDKLRTFNTTRIKLVNQKAALYSIVFGEISDNPQLIRRLKKNYESRELDLLKSILSFGMTNGEFKKIDEEDLDNLSYIMLSSLRGIERGLLEDNRIKKMGDRLDFILDLLCHGIKCPESK